MLLVGAAIFAASQIYASTQRFDPRRDAEVIESCMGALAILQAAADHQEDKTERTTGQQEATRLRGKLKPYIEATVATVGSDEFYLHAALLHRRAAKRLDDIGLLPVTRTAMEHDLLKEAGACEAALDSWNAAPPR